jgi:hypothetical protein
MTTQMIGATEGRPAGTALGAAEWMRLAAAPTFAVMAFLTSPVGGSTPDMICAAAPPGSLLNGMSWMYILMCAFNSAPWLKLIFGRRRSAHRS